MPGETDLHKTLKKEACRWLYRSGYCCIAAEVRLRPLGIIDAVGSAVFRRWHNYLHLPRELPQVCFIECKASRGDFLRDLSNDGQMRLCMMERTRNLRNKDKRRRKPIGSPLRQAVGLGKFDTCIAQPMANLHYILAPVELIKRSEIPARWGLLSYGPAGVTVVVRAQWQEISQPNFVESAIARTLTGDIYRADDRAINSVNREIFAQQHELAERIRSIKPRVLFDVNRDVAPPPKQAAPPRTQRAQRK
jgi:hypothetical protein